jgi:hypothetical protein
MVPGIGEGYPSLPESPSSQQVIVQAVSVSAPSGLQSAQTENAGLLRGHDSSSAPVTTRDPAQRQPMEVQEGGYSELVC